jgi:hypothetical protein
LSFTAEEAWQNVPARLRGETLSVFDLELPRGSARGEHEAAELALWDLLKRMRAVVAAAEGVRDFQLQAHLHAAPALEPSLRALGDNLREALVVSGLTLEVDSHISDDADPRIVLTPAEGGKCSRCWKTLPLGEDHAHPVLCTPCAAIVTAFQPWPRLA